MNETNNLLEELIATLDEQRFEQLLTLQGAEFDLFFASIAAQDSRWLAVKEILVAQQQVATEKVAYFETRKSEAWKQIRPHMPKERRLITFLAPIAVAATLLLTAFAYLYIQQRNFPNGYQAEIIYSHIYQANGKASSMILLPDSSKVWLNKNSTLSYKHAEADKERLVKLDGEAYFEVKSSPEHPFIVQLEKGRVQVTGTRFFAGYHKQADSLYVDLQEGKVSYRSFGLNTAEWKLQPKERLLVHAAQVSKQPAAAAANYLWLRKPLHAQAQSLSSIVTQLEAWYAVPIGLADQDMANIRFTGEISPQEDLRSNIEKICWTAGIRFTHENKSYLLTK
ncbi:FecR family protein [Sphingobacterium bambusae]|uniref:FecR family protein n=1 Tax=Sphingobacterium bambusae TaxID=662858 RepID=A0ABW6BFA2_9SPHI|nr:FecR domain-containing protein [Sphingobacterium bambusae]WPL48789.1 FecR domain-containing protein [Sphingobacterium bambusae]